MYNMDCVGNFLQSQGTNYWRNRILKVAKDNTDFAYAISNKDDFQHEMSEYGLDYVA
jgi:protein disulfide isomerase family A protein 3